jgi:peptidoglycan endopeptidase LytE
VQPAPTWKGGRRYEAYPTLGRRGGWLGVPRVALFAVALAIAAIMLFFLPSLLGVGGGGSASPSPNASGSGAISSVAPSPTATPAPTQQVYVVKQGDTMSKIAKQFGLTVDELCNANKTTIKNCDKLAIGDELVIPAAAPQEFTDTPAPSAS